MFLVYIKGILRGLPLQVFEMLIQFYTYFCFLPTHISPLQLKAFLGI